MRQAGVIRRIRAVRSFTNVISAAGGGAATTAMKARDAQAAGKVF